MTSHDQHPTEIFTKTVRSLKILDESGVQLVLNSIEQNQGSPIAALLQSGLASPVDVDLVDLLMRANDAIPGYEVLKLIGRGGMGAVWQARQKSLDRIVALKTILASQSSGKKNLLRFEREAIAVSRLTHPNIVTALDFGKHQGRFFLAMEYIVGEDLATLIDRSGKLSEPLAWAIARQIAAGLASAGRQGIIHRDIKPANILLVKPPDGHSLASGVPMVKITDFGLALLQSSENVQSRLTSGDSALGSPHYMAPEQLGSDEIDTRADIYALGATVYQMLLGNAPWEGKSLQQIVKFKLHGPVPAVDLAQAGIANSTVELIERMMAIDPNGRPKDCTELLAEIDRLSLVPPQTSGEPNLSSPQSPPAITPADVSISAEHTKPPTPRRRTLIKVLGAVAILASCLVTLTFFLLDRRSSHQPVILVPDAGHSENQIILYDGVSYLNKHLVSNDGGWLSTEGKLVHASGSLASLTYLVPEWEYFLFGINVNASKNSTLDFEFGPIPSSGQSVKCMLRITNNAAQVGKVDAKVDEFYPIGKAIELDTSSDIHSVTIEKNDRVWAIKVDSAAAQSWILPFQLHDDLQSQITVVSRLGKRQAASDGTLDSSAALSEIELLKLRIDPSKGRGR